MRQYVCTGKSLLYGLLGLATSRIFVGRDLLFWNKFVHGIHNVLGQCIGPTFLRGRCQGLDSGDIFLFVAGFKKDLDQVGIAIVQVPWAAKIEQQFELVGVRNLWGLIILVVVIFIHGLDAKPRQLVVGEQRLSFIEFDNLTHDANLSEMVGLHVVWKNKIQAGEHVQA